MTFSDLVTEYLKHHTNRELADVVECIPSTVTRWASGVTQPRRHTKQWVINYINGVRNKENW